VKRALLIAAIAPIVIVCCVAVSIVEWWEERS